MLMQTGLLLISSGKYYSMPNGLERLVVSFIERLGDGRNGSSKEFGIFEKDLARTLVYDVTEHLFDPHVLSQPTWVTAKGDSADWIIGPNGKVSSIGVLWKDGEPILMRYGHRSLHFPLEDQSVYGGMFQVTEECAGNVVAVRQLVNDKFQIAHLLCVQIPQAPQTTVSWETLGRYIQGNALVSGVGHVGGPVRDFITRYKLSDAPLLQELKQR